MKKQILALSFLVGGAASAQVVNTVTSNDLPTHVQISNSSLVKPPPALFPEISIVPVVDERKDAKPCFGSVAEDRHAVAIVAGQALSAAGFALTQDAPLKLALTIQALDCAPNGKEKRHASWKLSGGLTFGKAEAKLVTFAIDGGRSVESTYPPNKADHFRDIDTPAGVAAASMRDRLRELFLSKSFQFQD